MSDDDDDDDGYFGKVDFVKLIGEGLLDLRENFNVATAATHVKLVNLL